MRYFHNHALAYFKHYVLVHMRRNTINLSVHRKYPDGTLNGKKTHLVRGLGCTINSTKLFCGSFVLVPSFHRYHFMRVHKYISPDQGLGGPFKVFVIRNKINYISIIILYILIKANIRN